MAIIIDDKYKVVIDSQGNYTLYKFYPQRTAAAGPNKGGLIDAEWKTLDKHYPNVLQAIHKVIDLKMAEEKEDLTVHAYVAKVRLLFNEMKKRAGV